MITQAQVKDYNYSILRRSLERSVEPVTETPEGIARDLADASLVAQHFANFAGYEWAESQFFLLMLGLCGANDGSIEYFDEELAEHARCADRTVRRWRKAYLTRSVMLHYAPVVVSEGDYDHNHKRYEKTTYGFDPETLRQIERAVVDARAMPDYASDRLKALERAAAPAYDEIPNAPASQRRGKSPRKTLRSPVVQSVKNAAKNLEQGKLALAAMPERSRNALLAGQGEELRAALLRLQAETAAMLSAMSETVESADVSDIPDKMSGIPPSENTNDSDGAKGCVDVRVRSIYTRTSTEPEYSPEAEAAWERTFGGLGKPRDPAVRRVEIEIGESPPVEVEPDESDFSEADSNAYDDQLNELMVVRMERNGLSANEAYVDVARELGTPEEWTLKRGGSSSVR